MDKLFNWNKFTWKSWVFLGALVIIFMILQSRYSSVKQERKVVRIANEMNKKAPELVDSFTRFDKAVANGRELRCDFTLVTTDIKNADTALLKDQIEQGFIERNKNNEELKKMLNEKTVMLYRYQDKNNIHLFDIMINELLRNK